MWKKNGVKKKYTYRKSNDEFLKIDSPKLELRTI